MPLSEYEQRVLDQLEQELGTDTKLKHAMDRPVRSSGKLLLAGLGVVAGLGVMLSAVMSTQPLLGLAGFALMLAAAMWAMFSGTNKADSASSTAAKSKGKAKSKKDTSYMDKLEERFNKRREQGDL